MDPGQMPLAEPYKIKTVEVMKQLTREERVQKIQDAHFNLFSIDADDVYIDLMSDSGTGAMSDRQWSAMMAGDESYSGSRSFHRMKEVVTKITGYQHVLPCHQGRAAENVLFSALVKEGDVLLSNGLFITTKQHAETRKARPVNCSISGITLNMECPEVSVNNLFRGNMDVDRLETEIVDATKENIHIPVVICTITSYSNGGQPVSMDNIREISNVCKKHNIPLLFDAARFAENAYFIKTREQGYAQIPINEICAEIFSYGDGMWMSAKKDAIVNMGGFIATNDENLYKKCSSFTILYEGFLTYGGMSGRDMEAVAVGLEEGTEFDYLRFRIEQVAYLGKRLHEEGLPVVQPFGGHAVFIDAEKFLPHVPPSEFPAQVLAVELYVECGVRGLENGSLVAGRDPSSGENRRAEHELLRLAIPRRVYSNAHMEIVVWALQKIYTRRETITGFEITFETCTMRCFTCKLKRK